MNKYKITTSWTGYSEITLQAKNKEEAEDIVFMGDYDTVKKAKYNEVYSTDDVGVEIFGMKKEEEQLVNIVENEDE
jgi:hypothetical protein